RLERREYAWRGEEQLVGVATLGKQARQYDRDARGCVVREIVDDATIIRAIDVADNVYRTASGQDRHYGPGGRLEQVDGHRVEHDEDGNLTFRADNRGEWRYSWNGHGLLSAVERPDGARVEFEYDGLARRIARRLVGPDGAIEHEVAFVWDGHTVVHELDSEVGLISWCWLPESATPILKMQGERRWSIASDHLGAPTHLHDENGAVVWAANLDIFGRVRVELGEVRDCPWRWPGQYDDGLVDEFYNRWRYYSPALGRFISQDPAGPIAGLNPYAYVDDPTLWIDLLGLTGAYIFSFATGKMYIGKGPVERALVSQRERTVPGDRISKGAHLDCGDNRMAFMVEAVLMERNKFSRNPDLLNEINSPGKKLLKAATPAEITAVTKLADALEDAYTESQGKICR
ncbi:MAG: hypothetical protein HC927_08130, partial [Deltaproteobacteria bacterium]|nr:hypothetical protein [Deltaproteobacteria bacterium]